MKQRRFAEGTEVPVDKTRAELEGLLVARGAAQIATAIDHAAGRAVMTFRLTERLIRLEIKIAHPSLPSPKAPDWGNMDECPRGWNTWSVPRRQEWCAAQTAQYAREAWRRLLLVTKAKLELVADGAETVETAFLANVLLPDGRTVHEALAKQLDESYRTGDMPKLLPPPSGS
jgi:hypothetical protein